MKNRISRRAFLVHGAAAPRPRSRRSVGRRRVRPPPRSPCQSRRRQLGPLARRQGAGAARRAHLGHAVATRQRSARRRHFALARRGQHDCTPLQSWPLAWWPDGSLKWTAHALSAAARAADGPFEVIARRERHEARRQRERERERRHGIEIDTGRFVCRLARRAPTSSTRSRAAGREALRDGHLVLLRQDRAASTADAQVTQENFESTIEKLTLEQRGPARAVVKVEGRHAHGERSWLPFTLRLYFYAGSDAVRVLHTIVFDGDESQRLHPRPRPALPTPLTRRAARPARAFRRRAAWRVRRGGARPDRTAARSRRRRARGADRGRGGADHRAGRQQPAAIHSGVRRLDAVAAERGLLHDPQAHHGWPRVARRRARSHAPAGSGTSAARRAASPSASATSGKAIRRSSTSAARTTDRAERHAVGVGARRAADGPALLSRRSGPGHVREAARRAVSRSPTRTTSPASARRCGVARTSELMLWVLPSTPDARAPRRSSPTRCASPPHGRRTPQHARRRRACSADSFSLPDRTTPANARTRGPARLAVRFLSRPAGAARLVRLLELRRRHAHLRLRSPRVALRRRRLRLGQLRARHRPVALDVLPAHRPRRRRSASPKR